jgi:hypothetical protein
MNQFGYGALPNVRYIPWFTLYGLWGSTGMPSTPAWYLRAQS